MLTFVYIAIGSWLVLGMLFIGFPGMQRLKAHRDLFDWKVKTPIYLALFFGVLADVAFNSIWGTIIFRELPREWLFTYRLKRHWHGTDTVQKERARPWVTAVNTVDPGHV